LRDKGTKQKNDPIISLVIGPFFFVAHSQLRLMKAVHPEVYPPSAAPEATRESKGERGFYESIKIHFLYTKFAAASP